MEIPEKFACNICNREYKYEKTLQSHMKTHNEPKISRRYPCKYCNKDFEYQSGKSFHEKSCNKKPINSFRCTICNTIYTSVKDLENHNTLNHSNSSSSIDTNKVFRLPHELIYNKHTIKYFKYNDVFYFKAKDITTILKYPNASYILKTSISDIDKISIFDILQKDINKNLKLFLQLEEPKTLYVTNDGIKILIDKKEDIQFKNWFNFVYTQLQKKPIETLEITTSKFKYKYNDTEFSCFTINDNVYFKAKEIATFLDYEDTDQSIRSIVNNKNKYLFNQDNQSIFQGPIVPNGTLENESEVKINDVMILSFLKSQDLKTIYINDAGMYEFILHSKKPEAKQFKQWVVSEVLPSIRKTGKYENNRLSCDPFAVGDAANTPCVYIIYVKDNLYKFGKSTDIVTRLNNHKQKLEYREVIRIYKFSSESLMRKFENIIKQYVKTINIHRKTDKGIEFFETENIQDVLKDLEDKYKDINKYSLNDIDIDVLDKLIVFEKEKTKQLELQLEIKKLDIELIKCKQ